MDTNQNVTNQESRETDTPHKHAGTAAVSIAGCAFAAFFLGSFWGAPWPGAVACCALCLMGVGVAYFIMGRA